MKLKVNDIVELNAKHRRITGRREYGVAKVLGIDGDCVRVRWIARPRQIVVGTEDDLLIWQLKRIKPEGDGILKAIIFAKSGGKCRPPIDWDRLAALDVADKLIDEHFVLKYPAKRNMARTLIADILQAEVHRAG